MSVKQTDIRQIHLILRHNMHLYLHFNNIYLKIKLLMSVHQFYYLVFLQEKIVLIKNYDRQFFE